MVRLHTVSKRCTSRCTRPCSERLYRTTVCQWWGLCQIQLSRFQTCPILALHELSPINHQAGLGALTNIAAIEKFFIFILSFGCDNLSSILLQVIILSSPNLTKSKPDQVQVLLTFHLLILLQISRMERELSLRRELIRVQTGVELSSHTHPYYCYIQSRLRDLQLRQRELTENSVHRPQQQQVYKYDNIRTPRAIYCVPSDYMYLTMWWQHLNHHITFMVSIYGNALYFVMWNYFIVFGFGVRS